MDQPAGDLTASRTLIFGLLFILLIPGVLQAGNQPPDDVAVWFAKGNNVAGSGSLPELLIDRLGSNGLYQVCDPERVRAAGAIAGLNAGGFFSPPKLALLGQMIGCRWVVWVKIVGRNVDLRKGLSIPHLFTRRKVVTRMLVDARVIDVNSGRQMASTRFRLDKSGAGSYQVAEDVRQDPLYNNSAGQLHHDARRLESEAARSISLWFKSLAPRLAEQQAAEARRSLLAPGPFVVGRDAERK